VTHQAVLLTEAIDALAIKPGGRYIDGTFGRGGHSQAILAVLPDGHLTVVDKDPEAIAQARKCYADDARVSIAHQSFADLEHLVLKQACVGKVDGILLDLGVSSPQLDDAERGFSFLRDGPLDMRMDTTQPTSAATYLAHVSEEQLARVLKEYGEERFSKRIAGAICAAQKKSPITRTTQLADIVTQALPVKEKHKHPATRTFQALRIAINDELVDLSNCLSTLVPLLKIGGRLCVISFHSLEDRLVKQFMSRESKGHLPPPGLPLLEKDLQKSRRLRLVNKRIRAQASEIARNVRARSAIMRVAERIS
jgi:16S rRNA (cytosine1402-N4)-methyltransferase